MSFGGILRQSTAVDVLVGPFVDSTDGDTEETGLTISQSDVLLSKNGQTLAQKNDANAAAHDADGYYNCPLNTTDSNTVGQLVLEVHVAGALAVRHDFQVIEEAVYDALYATSAPGPALPSAVADVQTEVDKIGTVPALDGAGQTIGEAIAKLADDNGGADYDATTDSQEKIASVNTEARLAELDAGNLPTDIAAVQTEVDKIGTVPALDGAAQTIGAAIGKLADDNAGADFDATTDSLERLANTEPLGTAMRGTDSAALATALATAQADLDTITGADGVTLATSQGNYAPAVAGDAMDLVTDALDALAVEAGGAAEIVDKLLGRNLAAGSDGGRTVQDALRALRNKWSIAAGTLTVYKEDDSTSAWTATVSTAAGDPIDSVDPA